MRSAFGSSAVCVASLPSRWVPVAVLLLAAAGVLLGTVPAHGWEVVKSSNGVVIQRGSEDSTATGSLTVFYGYKGAGDMYDPAYNPTAGASFEKSRAYANVLSATIDAIEIPLEPGYRVHYLYLSLGAGSRRIIVLNEPLNVKVAGQNAPLTVAPADGQSLPVRVAEGSLSVTASVDSTLPVHVVDVGDSETRRALLAAGAIVLLTSGVLAGRGVGR